jgi:hypothetical protein
MKIEKYHPYEKDHANSMYNLLFGDDIRLAESSPNSFKEWKELFNPNVDPNKLLSVIIDEREKSLKRLYYLQRLPSLRILPKENIILGVVVEVAQEEGLDTLAVYNDGCIRYINNSAAMAILETPHPLEADTKRLMNKAAVLRKSFPSTIIEKRSSPPTTGHVRITTLSTAGRTEINGQMGLLSASARSAPILLEAAIIINKIANLINKEND